MVELVSVIIPTHNEDGSLAAAIGSVRERDEEHVEVIVVDAGSSDRTREIAAAHADRVVTAPRQRAAQLNAGAAVARGSILLFLHADTELARGALDAVRTALHDQNVLGGAFTIRIGSGARMSVITWGTNVRSRWLRLPYGDQALFVRAETFRSLDGYRDVDIMEDVDFVRRMRRAGELVLLDLPARTSGRRWRVSGLFRTTFANTTALTLFRFGVPPHRIRRVYDAMLSRHSTG